MSRATLREALRILEEEKYLIRRHGVGTFVNSRPLFSTGIEQLTSVTKMIEQVNMTPGTIFLSSQEGEPTENDVIRFQCDESDGIFSMERVRTADGQPVVYCLDKIPVKHLPASFTHEEESLFELFGREPHSGIKYAVADIEPIGYHDQVSPILDCDPETALLLLKQMHYDQDDQPVYTPSIIFERINLAFMSYANDFKKQSLPYAAAFCLPYIILVKLATLIRNSI